MSVSFPGFPWWVIGGRKDKDPVPNGSSFNPSADTCKCPQKIAPSKRKVKRTWFRKREKKRDRDYDTDSPSDGTSSSRSEPDGLEWSIGWMEPHGPDFRGDDEGDGGFVVLVPCYSGVVQGCSNRFLSAIHNLPSGITPDGKIHMEQWLPSLQNF